MNEAHQDLAAARTTAVFFSWREWYNCIVLITEKALTLPRPASDPRPEGYDFSCPDGEWIARLDVKQWGKNKI
jgi:hypothetical protein